MRSKNDERNPHAVGDEWQKTTETGQYREAYSGEENTASGETPDIEEQQIFPGSFSPKKKNDEKSSLQLVRHLSVLAVTVTATMLIGVTALFPPSSPPDADNPPEIVEGEDITASVTLSDERVGLFTYRCDLSLANAENAALTAVMWDAAGSSVAEHALSATTTVQMLSFDSLRPETAYTLTVTDNTGETYLSHTFTTDPVFTFTPEQNGMIAFSVHEELSMTEGLEFSLQLLDSVGKDFSSNVIMGPETGNTIYTAGLYQGTHTLCLDIYGEHDVTTYEASLTLGELTPLDFSWMAMDTAISLECTQGELAPYAVIEVSLSSELKNYFAYGQDIMVNADNISAMFDEAIEPGEYELSIWGSYDDGNISLYSQIYKIKITI